MIQKRTLHPLVFRMVLPVMRVIDWSGKVGFH